MTDITVVIEPPLPDIEVTLEEVGLVGPAGPGVPVGGTADQVLAKVSSTDWDTAWVDQTGGSGGGGGSTVTLDADGTLVVDGLTVEVATDAQLASEATTRAAADTALTAAVSAEAATRATADTTEASARASAVTALTDALAAEASSRASADALLIPLTQRGAASGVATLDGSGTVPDAQLPASIARDTEVTTAVAAEATARAAAITAAISALVNGAPGILDTLGEIAAALAADESTAAALASTVATETTNRIAGDALALLKSANLSDLANAATARTNLGLGTAATHAHGDYDAAGAAAAAQAASQPLDSDLTAIAALTTTTYGRALLAMADAAATKTALALTKTDVGLSNVDNTSDASKPVSTAQAAADALALAKASNLSDLASAATARTNLGLGTAATANKVAAGTAGVLDATDATTTNARTPTAHASTHASAGSDPITIAESQVTNLTTDLAAKAPLASPALTGTPTAPTPATSDSSTTVATTAHVRAQRTAAQLRDLYLKPTAALYETIPRAAQVGASSQAMTTGTLYLMAIALPAGLTIGHLVFGIQAGATTPTNSWMALFDSSRVMLARTDDQLTAGIASGRKSLAITQVAAGAASSFTTTYEGLHYMGIMVAAATPGSLAVAQTGTVVNGDPPILFGSSNTGQTTPPSFPFTATALSSVSTLPWAYVAT